MANVNLQSLEFEGDSNKYIVPVQSVNGQTGDVVISVPTKTSDLTNDSGFITSAPVTSVNGQTGAVTVTVPTKVSDLTNDSGFVNAAGAASAAPVQSVNGSTGAVVLSIPTTAADVGALPDTTTPADIGAAPAVTEVTISTAGAVSQALDPGKIYHFTGAVSSLSLTLNAAASGQLAQYHFDFSSGSTAATVTLAGVTWPDGSFTPEASKHYEVDILNGYGVYLSW